MRILLKYFFWLLTLFTLVIYYLLGTSLGHITLGYFFEDYYSKKMDNKLEILSLDIERYPFIMAEIKINDAAQLSLKGIASREDMNLSYHLRGEHFKWDSYDISEPINLKGVMRGAVNALFVQGEGEVFHGETSYNFVRRPNRFEALEVNLTAVNAKDLLRFLEYDFELEGAVDVQMNFEYFSSFRKKGVAKIDMQRAFMPEILEGIALKINGEIIYKDLLRDFFVDIHSDIGKLRVAHGYYNKSAGLLRAEYGLHINELSYFEKLLGHQYQGELNTAGELKYERDKLSLLGDSRSYGGLLKYRYNNDYLDIEFKGVSLEKVLRQLSYPALLSAKIYGTASYDIKDEIILINTELKETRFRRTKMTDSIYEVAQIDILKDVYDDSIFTAGYQDSVLTSLLKIDNGVNHLYLRDTRMNSQTNEITAEFEVVIDDQEFLGRVYGTLEDPKVSLDMSKLIRYQINKKIENFFGTGKPLNKKNTKEKLHKIKDELIQEVDSIEIEEIKKETSSFFNNFLQ